MDSIVNSFGEKVKGIFRNAFPADLLSPEAIKNGVNLPNLVQTAAAAAMEVAALFIQMFTEAYSEMFLAAEEYRRQEQLVMHERKTRGMYFYGVGYVTLPSHIYRKGGRKGTNYGLLNEKLGLRSCARIDEQTRMRLLESAVVHSYRDSARIVTGGEISSQTVLNTVHNLLPPEPPLPETKRKVREIYVFMDEDHAHRQSNKAAGVKTGCQMVPFAVVCEGREKVCEGRHRLINPQAFVPEGFDTARLLKMTESYIYQTYDTEALEKIHVYGDGAAWITTALDEAFPGQTHHVHDALHRMKAIGRISRAFPGRGVTKRIYAALEKNDVAAFDAVIESLVPLAAGDARRTKILDKQGAYIRNQWDAMAASLDAAIMGSCSEPLVQHLLADRCSTRPMGWSPQGLQNMAIWRCYWYNGRDVVHPEPGSNERGFGLKYLEKVYEAETSRKFNFDIFEPKASPVIYDSGTQRAIRLCAAGGRRI